MAFAGCKKLILTEFPNNIKTIGIGAFTECTGITSLVLDNSMIEISDCAFWYCSSLTNISANVPFIGCAAFEGCKSLHELHLGKMVKKIGGCAFQDCIKLNKVYCLANNPPTTDESAYGDGETVFWYGYKDAFGGLAWKSYASDVELYVPETSIEAYNAVEPWKSFKLIKGINVPVESITLYFKEISILKNTSYKLSSTVFPDDASNKKVIWSSSDASVATVDESGTVTAVNSGEVWIKAISDDNPEACDSCKVTVTQAVTGIELDITECTLNKIGQTIQLTATVLPENANNQNVNWKSSNESVCFVSNGKVVAVGFGTAVIIATTEEGGHMAICTVTVEENTVLKGDVNLDEKVDISDIVAIINTIAGDTTFIATSDVNNDGKTDISDVVSVINIIAGSSE